MSRNGVEIVAAIDVGSNLLKMIIAQITPNGEYFVFVELERSSSLGKDSFTTGRISMKTIRATCDVLNSFTKLMHEYKVKIYRAVSTSGIREAENREYVLEQIRLFSGLNVEVINNAEERFYMYKALNENLPNANQIYKDGALILNIGSGGVEVTIYNEGTLKFTEYIKVGALRLHELFSEFVSMDLNYSNIIEEYVTSKIDYLKAKIEKMEIKNFIGLGNELLFLSQICHKNKGIQQSKVIYAEEIKNEHQKLKNMIGEQIAKEFHIQSSKNNLIIPSLIILNSFLEMSRADRIYTPFISLKHGLLADIIDDFYDTRRRKVFINDIINSVKYVAWKYALDESHYEYIESLSLRIFDATNKIHKLKERERLYLQIAALLHDVGTYVNLANHDKYCYNIINSEDIMGLSEREMTIVANIARYHSDEIPDISHESYAILCVEDRLIVSKLTAMLKIAESLDISHKKKINELQISCSGRKLIFTVRISDDILLEKWKFKHSSMFLQEVLGYECVLIQKS